MNEEMQQQLNRIDSALTSLIDSISAFNPSVPAADALLEADDALYRSTQRLAEHQDAVNRVKELRATSETLDQKIKSNITLLSDTRTELLKRTPVTLADNNARQVDSQELLNYAQRIARFTVPPTNRPSLPPPIFPVPGEQPQATASMESTDLEMQDAPDAAHGMNKGTTSAFESLDDAYKNALQPEREPSASYFVNWPLQSNITSGALYKIQQAIDEGKDPAVIDVARGGIPIEPSNIARAVPASSQPTEQKVRPSAPPPVTDRPVPVQATRPAPPKKTNDDDFGGDFDLYDPDE